MAKLHTPTVVVPLRKLVTISLFVTCVCLSTCEAAKLGSRSYEYGGGFLPSIKYPNLNSDENNTEPKGRVSPAAAEVAEANPQLNPEQGNSENPTKQQYSITVFPWNNHLGRPALMEWTDEEAKAHSCKEIPTRWQGKVRSINTYDNCVVLFNRVDCTGVSRTVKKGSPSHNRLSDICFQRKPMSARPCTAEEENPPSLNNL